MRDHQATSDHNVTETAFDAVKCKLCVPLCSLCIYSHCFTADALTGCVRFNSSAVTQKYFEDDFLRHFVPKPARRIPLVLGLAGAVYSLSGLMHGFCMINRSIVGIICAMSPSRNACKPF